MIKFLYANGDSYGFGQELDGPRTKENLYVFSDYQRNNCYSGIIANEFKFDYRNESLPGGSNQRIYRTLLKSISELLTKYKPNEIFVILSLSYGHRREFFYNQIKDYITHIPTWQPKINDQNILELWNLTTKYFQDYAGDHDFDQQMILGIQNFLRVNKVPYLMSWSMHHGLDYELETLYVSKYLLDQRYNKRFYQNPSFSIFTGNLNLPRGPGNHPLTEGHRLWADHIIKYIKQNNLFDNSDLYDAK